VNRHSNSCGSVAAAREKLAKISGIILSHQGLRLEVDGYTDSEAYNQKLSKRGPTACEPTSPVRALRER